MLPYFLFFLPILVLSTYNETLGHEYWLFNTIAYCSSSNLLSWKVNPITALYPSVSDIRVYKNASTDNQAYLAYNPSTTTIYLIFRGTLDLSIENWVLQDFNFFKTSYPKCTNCNVHEGFYQAYKNLQTSTMMNDLKSLKGKYPKAKVVISGHSLGGAMANFAYIDACDALGQVDLFITFGGPRVGDSTFAAYLTSKPCGVTEKIRVVHNRDPVPHVPPALFGFQHANEEVWYDEGSKTYVTCPQPEQSNCSSQILEILLNPIDHIDYLDFNQQVQMASCS